MSDKEAKPAEDKPDKPAELTEPGEDATPEERAAFEEARQQAMVDAVAASNAAAAESETSEEG